jgi:hypothetical protein
MILNLSYCDVQGAARVDESYDIDEAVALSNRINEIMRTLPPGTQPATVMTALCAVLARAIESLLPEHRQPAFDWEMALVRDHAGLEPIN